MLTDDYTVRLEDFEGPLDLLLHLCRKAEVEIATLPIATIADQYLEHLRDLDRIDVDLASEFLVMAATLVELKSRTLAPPEPGESDAGDQEQAPGLDPGSELIKQLLAFKWARDAAEALDERRHAWSLRSPAAPKGVDQAALEAARADTSELEIEDLGLFDLTQAFTRIVEQVNFAALGDHHVAMDETPIEIHIADILDQLGRVARDDGGARRLRFSDIFAGRSVSELIGLFLATLELVRRRAVSVRQPDAHGDIMLELNEEPHQQPAEQAE